MENYPMTATSPRHGRFFRAMLAYSARIAETYVAVNGLERSTTPGRLV
jgi:hypothetical protein